MHFAIHSILIIRFCTESNNGGEFPYEFCLHKSTFCLRLIPNNLQALYWTFLPIEFDAKSVRCRMQSSTTGRHANTHATLFIPTLNIDMMMLMMMAEYFFFLPRSIPSLRDQNEKEKIYAKRMEWMLDVTARRCWVNLFDSIIVWIRTHDYSHFRVFTLLMFANSSYNAHTHTHTQFPYPFSMLPFAIHHTKGKLCRRARQTDTMQSKYLVFSPSTDVGVSAALSLFSNLREDAISFASYRRCHRATYIRRYSSMNWSLFRLDLDIENRTEWNVQRIKLMMNLDYIFHA